MFTGIIEMIGTVKSIRRIGAGGTVSIEPETKLEIQIGDSVAVNGVCLTASALEGGSIIAHFSEETASRTTIPRLRYGERVNLELALPVNGRFGGHLVQGHIDCIGRISSIVRNSGFANITIDFPAELSRYVVEKGSIAIDGVSLTVASKTARNATIALIPETVCRTVLISKKPGNEVNIEFDIIAKYIDNQLKIKTYER